jgi:hypothetical protein
VNVKVPLEPSISCQWFRGKRFKKLDRAIESILLDRLGLIMMYFVERSFNLIRMEQIPNVDCTTAGQSVHQSAGVRIPVRVGVLLVAHVRRAPRSR